MITYSIRHITTYRYEFPVSLSHHVARLKPLSNARQQTNSFDINVSPEPQGMVEREDYFGNALHQFSVPEAHQNLTIEARSEVQVESPSSLLPEITATCREVRSILRQPTNDEAFAAQEFTFGSPLIPLRPELRNLAREFLPDSANYLSGAMALANYIYEHFKFDPTATDVSTPVETVWKIRRGVCQDFAHLAIACLRAVGLPVRYASGYILTNPPPGKPRLEGADASHAWISIYDPDLGWIDIDPTNNLICDEQHIVIGYGRDYEDVSLVRGAMTGGGRHSIEVAVTVAAKDDVVRV